MTNTEILNKAIDRALANGFNPYPHGRTPEDWVYIEGSYPSFIWDHKFAQAIWGSKPASHEQFVEQSPPKNIYAWKYHLVHMVLAADPIKYLEANL